MDVGKYSALKIRVFQTCRLRYRYQYLDKGTTAIKPRLRPADTAGSLVHRVLCDFYTKLAPDQRTESSLIELFESGWSDLSPGYHRVPGVEQFRESSLKQLRNFIQFFQPVGEPFLVEPYIQVEVAQGVTLFGRLDRLDENADGSLHVIDYKGGAMPGDIDSGQLLFYALMAEIKYERRVSRMSFWYLDDGSTLTSEPSELDKDGGRTELLRTIEEMERVTSLPPNVGPHCAGCPFLYACEVRGRVQERRILEGW